MNTTQNAMNETFEKMSENFNSAFDMALKFQQDSMRFWTDAMSGQGQTAGEQFKQVADEFGPTVQKNMGRFGKLVEEQANRGVELIRKSVDGRMPQNAQEANDRWLEMWKTSFDVMRDSADAIAKANAEMIDGFEKLTHKAAAKATDGPAPRTKSRK